jgi:hypothetical protein
MNYLREINSFRLYLKTNPIPATAQALWYVLIDFHNSCGWERWITIDNLRLQAELMISKPTLIQYRLMLIQAGLLEYKSQQKRKNSGKYKLLSFDLREVKSGKETGQNSLPEQKTGKETGQKILPDSETGKEFLQKSLPDSLPDRLPDPLHINKLNETKQKEAAAAENSLTVLDHLACEVLDRVCTSPLDVEVMKKMLAATKGDLTLIQNKVREIKANYKPKFEGDRIKTFSYFLSGVLEEAARREAQARELPPSLVANAEYTASGYKKTDSQIAFEQEQEELRRAEERRAAGYVPEFIRQRQLARQRDGRGGDR